MFTYTERLIALRNLRPKRKLGFLKIISLFSFLGIMLGVAVLIIVMSVMNGFRSELVNKILGFNSHIIVQSHHTIIDESQRNKLGEISKNYFLTSSGEVVLINKNFTKGLAVRGYKTDEFKFLPIFEKENKDKDKILKGKTIAIGKELSYDLNLIIGDKILLMSPKGEQTIIGNLPKQEIFTIELIFDSGLADFDRNIIFTNINNLDDLLNIDRTSRNLEIFLKDPLNIEEAKLLIQKIFPDNLIYSWADINKPLFSALKVERNVMFIILSLIIIVAAFNIISGLTILVKNKTKEIAILKSIGVLNKSITKIFFLVGFYIGLTATIFGVIVGVLFSVYIENIRIFLSKIFDITLFPEEIYFLSKMPAEIDLFSVGVISISSIASTIIVSIFPAIKASKLDPIQSLKYE